MWQEVRAEFAPELEIVTVGLDVLGAEACRPFIEAANPEHPSLIDVHHRVAELFGIINIPNSVWINERGIIVRPAETAPAPRRPDRPAAGGDVPERLAEIFTEAQKIQTSPEAYYEALTDWVANGDNSVYALSPDEVVDRSDPRSIDAARGHAHFQLATHLELNGDHEGAVEHFRHAHELVPENFSYKRQAWSLETPIEGPLARFWQGPDPADPAAWPYDGDWLADVKAAGAENYYRPWKA